MAKLGFFRGTRDLFGSMIRDPRTGPITGLLGVVIGLVGLWAGFSGESTVAAVMIALLMFLLTGIAIYGAEIREKYGGLYEVLEHKSSWDICAPDGSEVLHRKTMKVRFRQTAIAIHDYVWGDGDLTDSYLCAPGEKVHEFRRGSQTWIVISFDTPHHRGDEADLVFERRIRNGFLEPKEWVEVELFESTERLTIEVIFPKGRPPADREATRVRRGGSKTVAVEEILVDARRTLRLIPSRPRQGDKYLVRWSWEDP